jgi:hypothetical protein
VAGDGNRLVDGFLRRCEASCVRILGTGVSTWGRCDEGKWVGRPGRRWITTVQCVFPGEDVEEGRRHMGADVADRLPR